MRKSNEVSLKDALKLMVNNMRIKKGLYEHRIAHIWKTKMGNTIARNTSEVKLRGKKLFLTINSAALKQELSYSKPKIIEMINAHLGEDFLEEVVIR